MNRLTPKSSTRVLLYMLLIIVCSFFSAYFYFQSIYLFRQASNTLNLRIADLVTEQNTLLEEIHNSKSDAYTIESEAKQIRSCENLAKYDEYIGRHECSKMGGLTEKRDQIGIKNQPDKNNNDLESIGETRSLGTKYEGYSTVFIWLAITILVIGIFHSIIGTSKNEGHLKKPFFEGFSRFVNFTFSPKNCEEVFEPLLIDWQSEYFAALNSRDLWKARWINLRYSYAFLIVIWQKSPVGDLIDFIVKIAK